MDPHHLSNRISKNDVSVNIASCRTYNNTPSLLTDIIIGKRHTFFKEARHAVHKKYSTDIVLLYYYSKHGPAESP